MAHDSEGSDQLVVGIIGPGAVGCALVRRLFPIVSQLGMIGRQGPSLMILWFTKKVYSDLPVASSE